MNAIVQGVDIAKVAVIDDDENGRNTYKLVIEDMESTPILSDGPLPEIDSFVANLGKNVSAAFCDYHLKKAGNYATFDGDQLAAKLYLAAIPVVLCTRFTDWEATVFRRYRRHIPRIISYEQADPSVILEAFGVCIREFNDDFDPIRRPWRALVRFEEIEEDGRYWYAVVPSWDAEKRIAILNDDIPAEILGWLAKDRTRFHASVNLGAEFDEELFFTDWEVN